MGCFDTFILHVTWYHDFVCHMVYDGIYGIMDKDMKDSDGVIEANTHDSFHMLFMFSQLSSFLRIEYIECTMYALNIVLFLVGGSLKFSLEILSCLKRQHEAFCLCGKYKSFAIAVVVV